MKRSAQLELLDLDLQTVIQKMNSYATMRLKNVDVKKLEGKQPEDFTSDVILKVLEGTRDWENAKTNDMVAFLIMCLNSEISHFFEKSDRRNIELVSPFENDEDAEKLLVEL